MYYLSEIANDEVFYRHYGNNIKLARIFPVPEDSPKAFIQYKIKFDEVSKDFKELSIIPWTLTEFTFGDLYCVWGILKEEPYTKYYLNNEKPVVELDINNNKKEEYIPKTFDEAVDYLVSLKIPCNESNWHHSGGMNLRNNWGLWGNKTPIAKWFTNHKLFHGDDRSGILSDAVEAKINGQKFDVMDKIKYYQEWWPKQYGEKCSLENMEKDFFSYNKKYDT